ncbi:MAG: ferrous iron transport protein A [Deltaproteobacteria bacterium]|jgi:Fe2+ transport system protein FeoA|nr:ferrous iron transport protein A [Deltaproteobacteria bacterium]
MVTTMAKAKKGQRCVIRELNGERGFLSRLLAQGLTPGTKVEIKQCGGGLPILIQARDTTLAMNPSDADEIHVELI